MKRYMSNRVRSSENGDVKQRTTELLELVEYIDVKADLADIDLNAHSLLMQIHSQLVDKHALYNDRWIPIRFSGGQPAFFHVNRSSTYTLQFLNGYQIRSTRNGKTTSEKVWYTDFDRLKFLGLLLDEDF